MADERVLCVPTPAFHALGRFQGFSPDAERYLDALLRPGVAVLMPRSEVEDDTSWKQLIPYCFLSCGHLVFTYRRGGMGGESRLHRRLSLGIGGHVSGEDYERAGRLKYHEAVGRFIEDTQERLAFDMGADRELAEEITCVGRRPLWRDVVGLLNHDDDPVGAVHLGVVMRVELSAPRVEARCASIEDGRFIAVEGLAGLRSEMESWSAILCDHLPLLLSGD
jgi:predicted NUDIX family phosphoesterase